MPNAPTKFAVDLAAFKGLNPSGQWRLYVRSRGGGNTSAYAQIAYGWTLNITTAPTLTIVGTPVVNINENGVVTVNYTVGDDYATTSDKLTVTATSSNPTLLPVANIAVGAKTSFNRTATLTPALFQNGQATVTLTVTRNDGAATTVTLPVITVNPQNIPPTISRLDAITMNANEQATQMFLVFDGDTRLQDLVIRATSEDQTIVSDANLLFFGKTNQLYGLPLSAVPQTSIMSLSIAPNQSANGATKVHITVTDPAAGLGTNVVDNWFWLTVNRFNYPPNVSPIGTQYVSVGNTTPAIGFTVNSPVTNVFQVSAISSDQTLVPNGNITVTHVSGDNWTIRIRTQGTVPGPQPTPVTITLTASDLFTSTSQSFTLNVLPPRERTYNNNQPIVINDNAPATPYPSTIKITDLVGSVSKVTVTLNGFTHTFPSDVGVMLVSPSGQKVVLMNNAGQGGVDAIGANLKFDQTAGAPIPATGGLVTGAYEPADYKSGSYNFPAPAPNGPYTNNTLDALIGGPAAGTWSLYVYDSILGDAGVITNGWTLAITTMPTISGLANVFTTENVAVAQTMTINEDSLSTPVFTFNKASSNPTIIPVNNIQITPIGTTGKDFQVTVTPASFGSNTLVTISATNGDGQTATKSFTVDVGYKATPPVVGDLTNATIGAGSVYTVNVSYSDAHTPTGQLKVGLASSNTGLVPQSGLKLVGNTLTVNPAGSSAGVSTISLSVTNNDLLVTTKSFDLTVTNVPGYVANTGQIIINDASKATPYPSTVSVGGLLGGITKVTVAVNGLSHTYPQDISMLLVGPNGQSTVLMSKTGGNVPANNVRLLFDDTGAPISSTGALTDGTYSPTDAKLSDSYFSPAPAGPYGKTLSVFTGTSANGTWSLYVQDDAIQDSGAINQGWALNITTSFGQNVAIGSHGPSLAISQNAEGLMLNVTGTPNVDYSIQSTTDLQNWSDAGTVTADDNGKAQYSIKAGAAPAQFFRAMPK